jgi:hypothetical protein
MLNGMVLPNPRLIQLPLLDHQMSDLAGLAGF